MEFGHLRTVHLREPEMAQLRHDVQPQKAPEGLHRRGPAVHPDMGLHVALGEIRHRGLRRHGRWDGLKALLDAVDGQRRLASGVVRCQIAVAAQREALRPPGQSPGLHAPHLAARGIHPDAEARKVPVPDHDVARFHGERIDGALGKLDGLARGHGANSSGLGTENRKPKTEENAIRTVIETQPTGITPWSCRGHDLAPFDRRKQEDESYGMDGKVL